MKLFEARKAQMDPGKLTATRHSSAATARRVFLPQNAMRLLRALPAAVQKSHEASMIPSDISLPLKTTINSRISTICAMSALKPMSGSVDIAASEGALEICAEPGFMGACTNAELEYR